MGIAYGKLSKALPKALYPVAWNTRSPLYLNGHPRDFLLNHQRKKGWCQIGTMINFTIPKYHPKQNVCVLDPSSRSTS